MGSTDSKSRKVFTTDKNDKDFFNNETGFDPKTEVEARHDFNQTIGNYHQQLGRIRPMSTAGTSHIQIREKKISDFNKIIDYLWAHDKKATTLDAHKVLFGASNQDKHDRKKTDNRMQDVKWASHIGKDLSEQKFIIQPYGDGWRINPSYDSGKEELKEYCSKHSNNRSMVSVFKKKNGIIDSKKFKADSSKLSLDGGASPINIQITKKDGSVTSVKISKDEGIIEVVTGDGTSYKISIT